MRTPLRKITFAAAALTLLHTSLSADENCLWKNGKCYKQRTPKSVMFRKNQLGAFPTQSQQSTQPEPTPQYSPPESAVSTEAESVAPISKKNGMKTQFIIGIMPISFLFSSGMNDLSYSNGTQTEQVKSSSFYTPSVDIGLGFAWDSAYLDVTVGYAMFNDHTFKANSFDVSADVYWRATSWFALGGGVSVLYATGAKITYGDGYDLSNGSGAYPHIALLTGSEVVQFKVTAGYLTPFTFNTSNSNGYTPSQTSVNMSGTMVEAGLVIRF